MNGLRLTLPSRHLDLTRRQLLFVARLFLQKYSETEFLTKAFLFLSGIRIHPRHPEPDGSRWYQHRSQKKPFVLPVDLMPSLIDHCRFLLRSGEINPPRFIRLARSRHFRLYNATFEEYLMAENYFFAYLETRQEQHLSNLISVLYRYPWQRWNAARIRSRAKKFKSVDPAIRYAVWMWYVGFREYIPKRCPSLFSGRKSERPFSPREYLNALVHHLNNGDITITDRLMKRPCMEALDELEQRAIEAEIAMSKS